jgi:hypothetical protein
MHSFTTHLQHIYPVLLPFIQWLVVACLCASAFMLIMDASRSQPNQMVKALLTFTYGACGIGLSYLILTTPPLLVAKLALIVFLICAGFFCLICVFNVHRFHRALTAVQQECELMTNLTFLQGEMTRAQLEQLNERIRQATEPEEREITETMLKSLSPLVMLFLRKEKSIIQWSLAAANIGKDMLKYIWSPSQH